MFNRRKWLDVGRYFARRRWGLVAIAALLALGILALGYRPLLSWADAGEADRSDLAAPVWVEADAGTPWKIFGLEIVGKIMSAQTDGAYSVVISTTPPEGGPPLHVHEHEDELFYSIKGTYEFRFGDETILASAGDLVHLPAHIPHRFRNVGPAPGMAMNTMTPGGFEQFFVEIDQLPKGQPLDRSQVAAIASRYGLQFLPESPSPER
ncbi:cupin domain-containing protein [Nodosilinea sp. AN01ver1]|uniref:cupin domain-containing protein n=1 Tax=Nodosilinea sp. AN01ver1 TaxID=3423362 RepID=UPI003D322C14